MYLYKNVYCVMEMNGRVLDNTSHIWGVVDPKMITSKDTVQDFVIAQVRGQ
jgi:hypothetical protein